MINKKVLIGISGGVDSAVSAYLLKQKGYEVVGVTFIVSEDKDINNSIIRESKLICKKLCIKHYIVDCKKLFKEKIIKYFINSYLNGETPNPCVFCNINVKFKILCDVADNLNIYNIATGHYAKIKKINNIYHLFNCFDKNKDQIYFLYRLNQDILKRVIFPLSDYNKISVKEIYKNEMKLNIDEKKESQDICFIKEKKYSEFIKENIKNVIKKGNFIDKKGNILGVHKGIIYYTIGQRKGINISNKTPLYVKEILPETNEIVLDNYEGILKNKIYIKDVVFFSKINQDEHYYVKVRYNEKSLSLAKIKKINDCKYEIILINDKKVVSKGQSAVLYKNNTIICGGVIL